MSRLSKLRTVGLVLVAFGLLCVAAIVVRAYYWYVGPGVPIEVIRAVGAGDVATLEKFIEEGWNINARGPRGRTTLERAIIVKRWEVVEFLVASGADVNKGNPLHHAVAANKLEIVRLLLDHGADVNAAQGSRAPSCLVTAARKGNLAMLELLVEYGGNVRIDGPEGGAVTEAAWYGYAEALAFIISKGGNPNQAWRSGQTALHSAAMEGYVAVVEVLLAAGAVVDTKDKDGESPLQAAEEAGHEDVAELLRKALARE